MADRDEFTLVGLGEILWDLLPAGKQLGGAPANFAYHAQALGGEGVVVSCIGDDELGKEITDQLEGLRLDTSYIAVDKEHPTGTVTVELDEQGKPEYIIHENVAWDFIPSSDALLELAGRADAVCFGSLCQRSEVSRDTVRKFLQSTRPECVRVFDINIRQHYYNGQVIHDMLELSSVLKLNDEELPLVAELMKIEGGETDILAALTDRYDLDLIVLTKGSKGSRLWKRGEDSSHDVFETQIADTVGAGDSFTAAITLGLLHGQQLDRMNEHANRLAAFVCSQHGATPRIPDDLKMFE